MRKAMRPSQTDDQCLANSKKPCSLAVEEAEEQEEGAEIKTLTIERKTRHLQASTIQMDDPFSPDTETQERAQSLWQKAPGDTLNARPTRSRRLSPRAAHKAPCPGKDPICRLRPAKGIHARSLDPAGTSIAGKLMPPWRGADGWAPSPDRAHG